MRMRTIKVIITGICIVSMLVLFNVTNKILSYAKPVNKYIKPITKEMSEELTTNGSKYNIYYGMLHSHTSYSDGQGTPAEAFNYAKTKAKQMDFFSITEHSQCFDNCLKSSLKNGSVSNEWNEITSLTNKLTTKDFVALYGYEMTWSASKGIGHINTFNTNGFVSATATRYTNGATALKNYYNDLVTNVPNSFSQFNHPSVKWGHFNDFEYISPKVDGVFSLLEMPGYHTSKDITQYCKYYQRALDKGWHISPSNNQDNHKKDWGTLNNKRSVVLAKSLTKNNIYDAIKKNRTYSTEDLDFYLKYTLNGYMLGSKVNINRIGDNVTLKVSLNDPTDASIGKLEVVVNNGVVVYSKNIKEKKTMLDIELPATYSLYYVRIKQNDGDAIVSAPVWLGNYKASTSIVKPTVKPTTKPTQKVTTAPTVISTQQVTVAPTMNPTQQATIVPTQNAGTLPTVNPPLDVTVEPSSQPSNYLDPSVDEGSRPEVAEGDDSNTVQYNTKDIGSNDVYDDVPRTSDDSRLYGLIYLAIVLLISIIFEGIFIFKKRY